MRNTEKAIEYADMQSDFDSCRETTHCHVLKGDERVEEIQRFIIELADTLARFIYLIRDRYPTDEQIRIMKYVTGIYEGLFAREDYGFFSVRLRQYHKDLALLYAENRLSLQKLSYYSRRSPAAVICLFLDQFDLKSLRRRDVFKRRRRSAGLIII